MPFHVEAAYRQYLKCGILAHGFCRAYCAGCGHDLTDGRTETYLTPLELLDRLAQLITPPRSRPALGSAIDPHL